MELRALLPALALWPLAFLVRRGRHSSWSAVMFAILSALFLVWAASDRDRRFAHLLFALLAFAAMLRTGLRTRAPSERGMR